MEIVQSQLIASIYVQCKGGGGWVRGGGGGMHWEQHLRVNVLLVLSFCAHLKNTFTHI